MFYFCWGSYYRVSSYHINLLVEHGGASRIKSFCLSIYLSVCLPVCLSVCPAASNTAFTWPGLVYPGRTLPIYLLYLPTLSFLPLTSLTHFTPHLFHPLIYSHSFTRFISSLVRYFTLLLRLSHPHPHRHPLSHDKVTTSTGTGIILCPKRWSYFPADIRQIPLHRGGSADRQASERTNELIQHPSTSIHSSIYHITLHLALPLKHCFFFYFFLFFFCPWQRYVCEPFIYFNFIYHFYRIFIHSLSMLLDISTYLSTYLYPPSSPLEGSYYHIHILFSFLFSSRFNFYTLYVCWGRKNWIRVFLFFSSFSPSSLAPPLISLARRSRWQRQASGFWGSGDIIGLLLSASVTLPNLSPLPTCYLSSYLPTYLPTRLLPSLYYPLKSKNLLD